MEKQDKRLPPKSKSRGTNLVDALNAAPKLSRHEWRTVFGDKRHRARPIAHFKRWQLQDAKARFSALFESALNEGPQVVTRRNKEAVVILSDEEYRTLADGKERPKPGMLETLRKCPKGSDLDIARDREDVRDLPPIFD